MGAADPQWEYFWSLLIIETKELAKEDVKMTQKVAAFKKAMHRAFTAGRKAGREDAASTKSAADAFADFRTPLTQSEVESAKEALKGFENLFGFTPGKFDTDEKGTDKPTGL